MINGNGSKKIETEGSAPKAGVSAVFEENIHLKFRVAKRRNDFQRNSLFKSERCANQTDG